MPDLPLYVQVAQSLGWKDLTCRPDGLWMGLHPSGYEDKREIPRYDLSWCHTGPLIERYKIGIQFEPDFGAWIAQSMYSQRVDDSPVLAVARLILLMAEQGRLNE